MPPTWFRHSYPKENEAEDEAEKEGEAEKLEDAKENGPGARGMFAMTPLGTCHLRLILNITDRCYKMCRVPGCGVMALKMWNHLYQGKAHRELPKRDISRLVTALPGGEELGRVRRTPHTPGGRIKEIWACVRKGV